ncbi:hypothetical protein Tco_1133701 [Tanacetum coccineum]
MSKRFRFKNGFVAIFEVLSKIDRIFFRVNKRCTFEKRIFSRVEVMAISVISISSDSSKDSVGTPAGRVILFGTIPTTIPDTTPSPDPTEDPSSGPYTTIYQFSHHVISSEKTPLDSDTPDTPPPPTHGTPFTEITASTQRSPIIPRRRVMILSPGQPIPHDASSDSSSGHSLSDHSFPDLPSTSAGPFRKRRGSPTTYVPALSPVSGALSPVRTDLIPSPKRVKDSGYLTDVEVDPREISLRDNAIVRVSDEPHLEQDIVASRILRSIF